MAVIDPFNPSAQGSIWDQIDARKRAEMGIQAPQSPQGPGFDQIDANTRQGLKLAQAGQIPMPPQFTRPEASFGVPGANSAPPSTLFSSQQPPRRPSGPIAQPSPLAPAPAAPAPSQASQPAQSDNSNGSAWINPAQLAGMDGSGTKGVGKPGDGLMSFLGSGAPKAFQGPMPDGKSMDTAYQPPGQGMFGGGMGEKGSPMSVLTGGSELDPKSALSGIMKLFGGGMF